MKSIKILICSVAVTMLAITGCGKGEDENPEPSYCYECTISKTTETGTGYAGEVEITQKEYCGITEDRADRIEKDGTWRKQQPDQWGIRLIWIDSKTICNRK